VEKKREKQKMMLDELIAILVNVRAIEGNVACYARRGPNVFVKAKPAVRRQRKLGIEPDRMAIYKLGQACELGDPILVF